VRVAANLRSADAQLKFAFPAWKEGAVEPATYRLLVRKWDVKPSPEHVKVMALPEGYGIRGILNDRKTLFITSHEKGHGLFFDTESGATKNGPQLAKGVEFSGFQAAPDGRTIAYGENRLDRKTMDHGGALVLWDLKDSKELAKFEETPSRASSPIAFSADGRKLYVSEYWRIGRGKDQSETAVWDLQSRRAVRHALPRGSSVNASPDRRCFATGVCDYSNNRAKTKVSLHDPDTGKLLEEFPPIEGAFHNLLFSPDGKLLIGAGQERTIVVWDAAAKRVLRRLIHEEAEGIHSIAVSPDSKLLAVSLGGSGNAQKLPGTIAVWSLTDGKRLTTLHGHNGAVWSVRFLADRRLISNGLYAKLRFWDLGKLDSSR
jgi:sugar lactone lactonase YvrE